MPNATLTAVIATLSFFPHVLNTGKDTFWQVGPSQG
jgi:hypothetical protein